MTPNRLVYLLFCGLLWLPQIGRAQLTVDDTYTPQQLIEDVLIGQGVQISNVQYTGNSEARGYFDGSDSNIGLSEGVIISTGKATDAEGPNGTPLSDGGTEFNGSGDPVLTDISGSTAGTFDAAIIEFDFVPSSDTVQFRYVFASNEYMFYVGAGVNDVFAFLISGPGIVGEENVALIPGTNSPVTIEDVNAVSNAQYYVDNENPPGETVEYNGFTTVLTASAVLTPCETYHIRLAIADGGDWAFDSAVFLEAGSFTSPSVSLNAESSFSASQSEEVLIEGCSSMNLEFERSAPYDEPLSVGLEFSGTATNGTDISNLPTEVNFAAGESTATLSFDVLDDGMAEGTETMTIALEQLNPCASGPPTSVSFFIEDPEPMSLQLSPDVSFVCPQEYEIEAVVSGGYPVYEYNWSDGLPSEPNVTVAPISSTSYFLTVTDTCGFTATGDVTVTLGNYQPPEVSVSGTIVCNGDDAELTAVVTGGMGQIQYLWNGAPGQQTYVFSPTEDTPVSVEVTDSCGLSASAETIVTVDEVNPSFTQQLVRNDAIEFENTTENTQSVLWDFGDGNTGTSEEPTHTFEEPGDYTVLLTVTNRNGCTDTISQEVTTYPPFHVYIPNSFTPNGDGVNDVFGVVGQGYLWYDLEIFNRWGQKVFFGRFRDNTAWDGTFKGKTVPAGTYVYRVWVEPPIGIEEKRSGVLNVLSGEPE